MISRRAKGAKELYAGVLQDKLLLTTLKIMREPVTWFGLLCRQFIAWDDGFRRRIHEQLKNDWLDSNSLRAWIRENALKAVVPLDHVGKTLLHISTNHQGLWDFLERTLRFPLWHQELEETHLELMLSDGCAYV